MSTVKEIMSKVSKSDSVRFMDNFNRRWTGDPLSFTQEVRGSLAYIGIYCDLTNGTANAVVSRMERKSGLSI